MVSDAVKGARGKDVPVKEQQLVYRPRSVLYVVILHSLLWL
jgi:hypothetical protein